MLHKYEKINNQFEFNESLPSWWWTGIEPGNQLNVLPLPNLKTCSRKQVLDYFSNGWLLNEVLFSSLKGTQAFMQAPLHGLRHPLIFYYGHPAVLFINKLLVANLINKPINPYFERIFEVGVDEMSWDDMSKNEMQWPSVKEVNSYRREVFNIVKSIIETHPDLDENHREINQSSSLWALFMGFEHDRIHLETSSVLVREMPLELLRKPIQWPSTNTYHSNNIDAYNFVKISKNSITLGKPQDYPSYGWDNEYGIRNAQMKDFEISKYMITNEQFLEFVKDNGYSNKHFWTEDGWKWKCYRNTKKPVFWVYSGPQGLHEYKLRTLFEEINLPLDWPVCVNYHEAKAYINWRSEKDKTTYRLPTEAEHSYLRRDTADDNVMKYDSLTYLNEKEANLCLANGSECSVAWSKPNRFGVHDIGGNIWDWCEDDFHPLEQFKVHAYYEDFSTPCFDGEHAMILGGSFISTGDEASIFARFHFRHHFFQHAGFHIVKSNTSDAVRIKKSSSKYDDKKVLDQYLLFHYGDEKNSVPAHMEHIAFFPQRCANKLIEIAKQYNCNFTNALDVGCAVGGASFELAKHFNNVIGVDISSQFIEAANKLKDGETANYNMIVEGEIYKELSVPSQNNMIKADIQFRRADACSLPSEYQNFDAVLASNLLCRLPSPKSFLARMGGVMGLVKPGGIVVFASPLSWSEQYTQKDAWLGGLNQENPQWSYDKLHEIMSEEFILVHREDMPFMIREHARKFEYVISDLTMWIRKN